ncbi:MAG: glycosyltransferase family 2 protein [Lachnospiraceae bacterium]|nr:glycosyltransferase family 2 protein [Lachnospiraceae bacterium]
MKKIAVLMATFNGEAYLSEMLDSIVGQKNMDFICYIHDDGSTDATLEIIQNYIFRYPKIFFLLEDDRVLGSAKDNFFYLMEQVEADYYFFADQDDVWLPKKMKKTYSALKDLEKHSYAKAPLASFCDMYVTDEELNIVADSFVESIGRSMSHIRYSQILIDNPAAGCTMCINRSCRDKALEIKNRENVEMHDVWCLLVAAVFGRVCAVEESLSYYRQHEKNEMGAAHESLGEKVSRNISDASEGKMMSEKEAFCRQKFLLAEEILKLQDVPEREREVLKTFIHPEKQSRFSRILFLKKNEFNRRSHSIWLWFWL